jgi:hypothetical protein
MLNFFPLLPTKTVTERVHTAVTVWTRIREVLASNLGEDPLSGLRLLAFFVSSSGQMPEPYPD